MSRNVLADQTQDQGVEAVRACAGRDDDDQHEGVKRFRQIEPIVDTIRSVDQSVGLDPLPPGRCDGDEDDDEQAKRGEWRQQPSKDPAAGAELDQGHHH